MSQPSSFVKVLFAILSGVIGSSSAFAQVEVIPAVHCRTADAATGEVSAFTLFGVKKKISKAPPHIDYGRFEISVDLDRPSPAGFNLSVKGEPGEKMHRFHANVSRAEVYGRPNDKTYTVDVTGRSGKLIATVQLKYLPKMNPNTKAEALAIYYLKGDDKGLKFSCTRETPPEMPGVSGHN